MIASLPARERGLVDVELVRIDRALHDRLAETVGGGDEDDVAEARLGIEREHDAAAPRSQRTMCCTPAESATAAWSKPWCTR